MRTIFFLLVSVTCFAQEELREFGIAEVFRSGDSIFIKRLITKVINVSEGTVTKMRTPPDSARLFIAPDGGIYEGVITWRKVGGPVEPPPTTGVDTVDGFNFVYTGWQTNSVISDPVRTPGWYKNTISYSTAGEAKYTFNGTGVELYAEKLPSHGSGAVTVGTQSKTVSWSGTKQLPALIFKSDPLPQGQHTISIKPVTGVVLIDFIVITR